MATYWMTRWIAACVLFSVCTLTACSGTDDDAAGDADAAVDGDVAVDTTVDVPDAGVEFINLRSEEVTDVRAVIRFDTTVPTTCEIEFGLAPDALDETAVDPDMEEGEFSLDHNVPLEDLEPETTYFYRAVAEDEDGDVFRSETQSFTTLPGEDGEEMVNVANMTMGTTVVSVSSNFGGGNNDSTWGIHHAFDGQMSTEWATNGDGNDAWAEIQLDGEQTFTHFAFRSRKMTDGTSIIQKVQLTLDGETVLGPFDTPDPDQRYEFELLEPRTASTVRIDAIETTGGNTGAKEIELLRPIE